MKKLLLFIILVIAGFSTINTQNLPPNILARELYEQGRIHFLAGELDLAIENLEAAIKLFPESAEVISIYALTIALYWRELGHVYFAKGEYGEAISKYDKAIQIKKDDAEDPDDYDRHEIEVYVKRGDAYFRLGNYNSAIEDYNQAILLNDKDPLYFINRGEAYRSMGDTDRAVMNFERAIDINRENTSALNNLGLIYFSNGNYDKAIEYFTRVIGIDRNHASAWNNRGCAYLEKEEYDKAIADFTYVLELKTNYDFSIVYGNRSRAFLGIQDYDRALDDCNRALQRNPNNTPALNNMANIYFEMGYFNAALSSYNECLEKTKQSININDISVYAWYLAGKVYHKFPYLEGDIKSHSFWSQFAGALALEGISEGIKNAENIRQNMGAQGAGLMSQMLYLYYAGVDLEATFGSKEKVFLYSESLRNRGFLEQIGAETAIKLEGVKEEERAEFIRLRSEIDQYQLISNTYDSTNIEGTSNDRYLSAISNRDKAKEELAKLDSILGERVPRYTALRNPEPVTLNDAKAYCGDDRAVLMYVLWDPSSYNPVKGYESWNIKNDKPTINSYCLVITGDSFRAIRLDADFNYKSAINDFYIFLSDRRYRNHSESIYEELRNDLYDYLIKPVLPYIENKQYLTIIPDRDLALIPFDMLRENRQSRVFGENKSISLSPSLSVSIMAGNKEITSISPIMFFANDIYASDTYVEREYPDGQYWTNLPGIKREIENLQNIARSQNIEYTTYFRENATKKRIQYLICNNEFRKYPIIHFACHGFYLEDNPKESGLVLYLADNEGYLTIPEIAVLDLNARMVILSACETGVGEAIPGEGMIGLVRAFMTAGAASVGVSLWEIDDDATALFKGDLYQKVLIEKKSFHQAYKEVKERFRRGEHNVDDGSQMLIRNRPFYWAAFTMYE